MEKSDQFNNSHFTGAVELSKIFFRADGDDAVNHVKHFVEICADFGVIAEVAGCMVGKASGTEAEVDALEIAQNFPKERWHDVCYVRVRDSSIRQEFEKDPDLVEELRADWIVPTTKSVEITIEIFRSAQAQTCVYVVGSGGHSEVSRESIRQLAESDEIPHLYVVVVKPENDKLAQPFFEANIKFLREINVPYVIFQSETDEDGKYTGRDYVNCLSFFGIICPREAVPEQKRSELDALSLVSYKKCKCGMKIAKGHLLKIEIGRNSDFEQEGRGWSKVVDHHRDITIDSFRRSLKKIGTCDKCFYTIVGDVNRFEIEKAQRLLGVGLEYRFVQTDKKYKNIVIGKLEPQA